MTARQVLGWFAAAVREWSWRHTAIGLLVGSLALFNMGGVFFYGLDFPWLRSWVYNVFEFGLTYVLAVRVADRAVADGVPRVAAYSTAVVGVIALGVWVIGPLLFPIIGGDPEWGPLQDVFLASGLVLPFSIATVAYAQWRREQDTLARVHAAEMGRAREEQMVQSSRLLALQARVEPQFLFDSLQRVRTLIDTSAQAAERLLGDLIALLRALQPAAGASASTVRREFALVEAFARASEAAALQPPRLKLDADPAAAGARLAPLVLLPVLRSLASDAPGTGWQVTAIGANGRLQVRIAPSSDDVSVRVALRALDLGMLQTRLRAVHGPDAVVRVDSDPAPALCFDTALHDDEPADRCESPDR
jgi:hypothetical protein